jgi:hypothetical protein
MINCSKKKNLCYICKYINLKDILKMRLLLKKINRIISNYIYIKQKNLIYLINFYLIQLIVMYNISQFQIFFLTCNKIFVC